jgi:hypothetical protein
MKKDIEDFVAKQIKKEYDTALSNQAQDSSDFEAVIDLLECKRTEKSYSWMSDVFYPEYPAVLLTESSQWANQYFASREYVDVYLEGDGPGDKEKCALVKKLLNKTLNRKGLFHYHKYMRARTINSTAGAVYAVCGWNQILKTHVVGTKKVPDGGVMTHPITGLPTPTFRDEEITEDRPLQDNFEYEVLDPRNVFTDNVYCYSPQEKEWITLRSEESYETLKMNERSHGYINLDKVKEILSGNSTGETETSKNSYNKEAQAAKVDKPVSRVGDVLTRYGKMWAVVNERDEDGNPTKVDYGYNDLGEIKDNAEIIESICSIFLHGSNAVLIRFQATPFIDAEGNPYKPIIRGLCYIHPTKDTGMSDGKYSRESQVALNDTINLSNDRVKLATIPVFVGDKYACEENDEIYIEPEHIIPIEGGPNNLRELEIRSDISGAMSQSQMFINGIHNVNAVFPGTMGAPASGDTTATEIANNDTRSNTRANYKSLTYEYTFLCDLYWQALQMSFKFMHPITALKLLGERGVEIFDPTCDYTYQPVTSNIEQEHGKVKKLGVIDQMLGRLVNVPNPKTPMLLNKLMSMAFELLGADYQDFKDALLDEGPEGQQAAMGATPQDSPAGAPIEMKSNQNGMEVSSPEAMVRM